VLTGYFGEAAQVGEAARLVRAVKAANARALYLCDPVFGDADRLYQPEPVAAGIRDRLLPLADIATPNRFELGWLAGTATGDFAETVAAAARLGRRETVVTSAMETTRRIDTMLIAGGEAMIASHRREPRSKVHGTGDLLAALYLGHRLKGRTPPSALAASVASVEALVRAAVADGVDELPLAAHQRMLLTPPRGVSLKAYGRRKTPKRKPREETQAAMAVLTTSATSGSVSGRVSKISAYIA
jgi:pyridoxine kinase